MCVCWIYECFLIFNFYVKMCFTSKNQRSQFGGGYFGLRWFGD